MDNQIKRIGEESYRVKSQSSDIEYDAISTELGWNCSCRVQLYGGVKCKHIHAVGFGFAFRELDIEISK